MGDRQLTESGRIGVFSGAAFASTSAAPSQ
jgi:hypothetical protein